MGNNKKEIAVEPLLPVSLGKGKIQFAQGMRAGRWVFASGLLAQDFDVGISPEVLNVNAPHSGPPKREKEAALIFDHIQAVLEAGGTSLDNVVRTDQYYTTVEMVPPYQEIRRRRFGKLIPSSTSIVENGFLIPEADMEMEVLAVVPDEELQVKHLDHSNLRGRPTSGYSAALIAGDYAFVPGITSMAQGDEPKHLAKATAAQIEEGMQWGGQPIKLEAEFIITERIVPSLELAGAKLEDVVKAQAYLTDTADYSAFNEVWVKHFGEHSPALSIIPCSEEGLAVKTGKLEINVMALRSEARNRKEQIDAGVSTVFSQQPQAIRTGDLLLFSALMANDKHGLISEAEFDKHQPYYQSSAETQAECILDKATRICEAAGASLNNVVRIQQFHTDLNEFYPVYQAWQRRLPGQPLPFSAIKVPGPLPVPGCTVMMDLWVYAP